MWTDLIRAASLVLGDTAFDRSIGIFRVCFLFFSPASCLRDTEPFDRFLFWRFPSVFIFLLLEGCLDFSHPHHGRFPFVSGVFLILPTLNPSFPKTVVPILFLYLLILVDR